MNTTEIYFVRHGETDWNVERRFQGQADTLLNAIGLDQAEALAAWFAHSGNTFHAIYSSDLQRCMETAQEIASVLQLPIVQNRALREIHCGEWEGLNSYEIDAKYPGQLVMWRNQVDKYTIPGGENVFQVQERIAQFYYDTVKKHPGESIIVVSHGAALSALLAEIEQVNLVSAWNDRDRRLFNTSVTTVTYDHDTGLQKVGLFNCTDHLG